MIFNAKVHCARQARTAAVLLRAPKARVAVRSATAPRALFGAKTATKDSPFYNITVKDIDNRDLRLSKYAGSVVLVCNVASQCGFTPQYNELTALYDKYKSKGLVVIGAPCNQFGSQEPGSNAEIKKFASSKGAKFPLLAKLEVNGSGTDPLYQYLKKSKGGLLTSDIKWNFTKFLIDREGNVVGRYPPTTSPLQIEEDIKKYL